MTARDLHAFSDVAEADQEGKMMDSDTKLFSIDHPPYITVAPDRATHLHGLEPRKDATADWNRAFPEVDYSVTVPEIWDRINYEKNYRNMLNFNPEAEKDLFNIRMALKTRDVCIVSGSPTYPYCPRKIVYDVIKEER